MGNPHAVIFTDDACRRVPARAVGPLGGARSSLPQAREFRDRKRRRSRSRARARLGARRWDTLACGTGACAIGVAAVLAGASDGRTTCSLPGGDLEIEWDGRGEVYLSGPATEVFQRRMARQPSAGYACRRCAGRPLRRCSSHSAFRSCRPTCSRRSASKIAEKRAEGVDVISFGIGDPDLPTPPHVIEALKQAADVPANHRYPETEGLARAAQGVRRVV